MARTAADLSAAEMEAFREFARRRQDATRVALQERRSRAWRLARRVADLLRKKYGATRVVVFGSLVHADRFSLWSDVDVAAWGLGGSFFRAVAETFEMDRDIPVHLVDPDSCTPNLLEAIRRDGVEL